MSMAMLKAERVRVVPCRGRRRGISNAHRAFSLVDSQGHGPAVIWDCGNQGLGVPCFHLIQQEGTDTRSIGQEQVD